MSDLGRVTSFLRAMEYRSARCAGLGEGEQPFVTISRQAAAGGTTLAFMLLQALRAKGAEGWFVYDSSLCHRLLGEERLSCSLSSVKEEAVTSNTEDLVYQALSHQAPQTVMHGRIFSHVRSLAGLGRVIFVGQGGACVTRDLPRGVHLRLVAPLLVRAGRLAAMHQLPLELAREKVVSLDRGRARMIRYYFNENIDDPGLYDAVWNTGRVPLSDIVRTTMAMLEIQEAPRLKTEDRQPFAGAPPLAGARLSRDSLSAANVDFVK